MFFVLTGLFLSGEIIDFRISEIDSMTFEERVLIERAYLDSYILSLNPSFTEWSCADSSASDNISQLPVEIVAIHHDADCLFAARRAAILEKKKRKYEFSIEQRKKKNERIELIRNTLSGAVIILQTGYTLYRRLAYDDKTSPAYIGVVAIMDLCVLLVHWQTTELIYSQ